MRSEFVAFVVEEFQIAEEGSLVFDQGAIYTLAKPKPLSVETALRHGEAGGKAQALVRRCLAH